MSRVKIANLFAFNITLKQINLKISTIFYYVWLKCSTLICILLIYRHVASKGAFLAWMKIN
jgi:hypothetical protein